MQLLLLEDDQLLSTPHLWQGIHNPLSVATSTTQAATGKLVPTAMPANAARGTTHCESVRCGPLVSETKIYTPLRPLAFERELSLHPDKGFVHQLVLNLSHGCNIGYDGPQFPLTAPNLPSAFLSPSVIDEAIAKECSLGRLAGPFPHPPMPNFRSSGIGLVPKKGGGWRLIHHLSAPPGFSINDYINPGKFSLSYATIDDAIAILNSLGPDTLMAKIDLKSAFRQCPVRPDDWHLLGLKWRDQFYFDKCLPFGLRSAPFLFDQVAKAIEWIARQRGAIHLVRYLDDFLTFGMPDCAQCLDNKSILLDVCSIVNAPVNPEKVIGPSTTMEFLGIWLDSHAMRAGIAESRRQELLAEIHSMLPRRTCKKREMLQLIGKLSFASKVVPAGRIFLRRLIDISTKVSSLHHHLTLTEDTRADLRWWAAFLPTWECSSTMLQSSWSSPSQLQLYTDASGELGYGAYYKGMWFNGHWDHTTHSQSITWKELYAIVLAASTWGHLWRGKRILFHCDNLSVVGIWAKGSSTMPGIMDLVRVLYFIAARLEFHVTIQHISGVNNVIADALSRFRMDYFFSLAPQANTSPSPVIDPRSHSNPSAMTFGIFSHLP